MTKKQFLFSLLFISILFLGFIFIKYVYFQNQDYFRSSKKYTEVYSSNYKNSLYSPRLRLVTEEIHKDKTTSIVIKNLDGKIIDILKPYLGPHEGNFSRKTKDVRGPEDIRILNHEDNVYIFYCDDYKFGKEIGYTLFMKQLSPFISRPIPLIENKHEKNWMPFISNNVLHVVYSFTPNMIIYKIDINTGNKFLMRNSPSNVPHQDVRGGTSGVPFENKILTLCHIQTGNKNYYHLFILFEQQFPFRVLQYSKPFKLQLENIQFATHLEIDEDIAYISYGIEDNRSVTIKAPVSDIVKKLQPI